MTRHLAIGDIHGCFHALRTLEAIVPFQADDVIITLGDYVDRGPDSCAVLDWLINRHKSGRLIPLRGNHEIMMLAARDNEQNLRDWLLSGGQQALASYSHFGGSGQLVDVPDAHWEFLENHLLPYHEIDTHFFVHGNVYPEHALADQSDMMLYWEKFNDPPPHMSGKIMVCGHTPQRSGFPRNIGHAVCLDTWAYGEGWLTCLDVAQGKFWQARNNGEQRHGWLDGEPFVV